MVGTKALQVLWIHNRVNYWAIACMLSFSVVSTLCDPMDCGLPGFSVHGISQARILEWVAVSSSREFLCLLHWEVDSLPLCHLGSPYWETDWCHLLTPYQSKHPLPLLPNREVSWGLLLEPREAEEKRGRRGVPFKFFERSRPWERTLDHPVAERSRDFGIWKEEGRIVQPRVLRSSKFRRETGAIDSMEVPTHTPLSASQQAGPWVGMTGKGVTSGGWSLMPGNTGEDLRTQSCSTWGQPASTAEAMKRSGHMDEHAVLRDASPPHPILQEETTENEWTRTSAQNGKWELRVRFDWQNFF